MQFLCNFIVILYSIFQTITLEDVDDYLITAAIHPAQVRKKKKIKILIFFSFSGHNAAQPRSRIPIAQTTKYT